MFTLLPTNVITLIAGKLPLPMLCGLWGGYTSFAQCSYDKDTFRVEYIKSLMSLEHYQRVYSKQDSRVLLNYLIADYTNGRWHSIYIPHMPKYLHLRWALVNGLDRELATQLSIIREQDIVLDGGLEQAYVLVHTALQYRNPVVLQLVLQHFDTYVEYSIQGEIQYLIKHDMYNVELHTSEAYRTHRAGYLTGNSKLIDIWEVHTYFATEDYATLNLMVDAANTLPLIFNCGFYKTFYYDNIRLFTWLYNKMLTMSDELHVVPYAPDLISTVLLGAASHCPRIAEFIMDRLVEGDALIDLFKIDHYTILRRAFRNLLRDNFQLTRPLDPQYISRLMGMVPLNIQLHEDLASYLQRVDREDSCVLLYNAIKNKLTLSYLHTLLLNINYTGQLWRRTIVEQLFIDKDDTWLLRQTLIDSKPEIRHTYGRLQYVFCKYRYLYPGKLTEMLHITPGVPETNLWLRLLEDSYIVQSRGEGLIIMHQERFGYLEKSGKYRRVDKNVDPVIVSFGLSRAETQIWNEIKAELDIQ